MPDARQHPPESNARDDRINEDGRPQSEPAAKPEKSSEGRDVPPTDAERGTESPWMGGG